MKKIALCNNRLLYNFNLFEISMYFMLKNQKDNMENKKLYAHVIVDVLASAVDKIFVYETDQEDILGYRVLVPFGNRFVEGYVLQVDENCNYTGQIKKIKCKIDSYPILNEERLELALFMRKRYHLKYIDILKITQRIIIKTSINLEVFDINVAIWYFDFARNKESKTAPYIEI